jgi:anti-sigma factor RsiW
MNCKCVSNKIGSYLDGELTGHDMLAVRSHLHRCDACAEEAESLRSLKSALSSLPCCEAPPDLEDRLLLAVQECECGSSRAAGLYWGSAAAAAAAGFLIAWFSLSGSGQGEAAVAASSGRPIEAPSFAVSRDQAYGAAADPLSGPTMVVTTSYER